MQLFALIVEIVSVNKGLKILIHFSLSLWFYIYCYLISFFLLYYLSGYCQDIRTVLSYVFILFQATL
jgi:hypothetical protein